MLPDSIDNHNHHNRKNNNIFLTQYNWVLPVYEMHKALARRSSYFGVVSMFKTPLFLMIITQVIFSSCGVWTNKKYIWKGWRKACESNKWRAGGCSQRAISHERTVSVFLIHTLFIVLLGESHHHQPPNLLLLLLLLPVSIFLSPSVFLGWINQPCVTATI